MKLKLEMFIDYFRDKKTHYNISQSFVQDGYGQKSGGYINLAKQKGILCPNQKWHLLTAYYDELTDDEKCTKSYRDLKCPELLLWIAEAASVNLELVEDAAKKAKEIIDSGDSGYLRNTAGYKIKTIITWEMIEERIQNK